MGNGVNISHSNHVSTIDMCGQKVLGMSGSLLNYINTGNPGPALSNDSFNKAKKPEIKEKKKTNFGAIIKGSIVALSVVAGGCLIFANRNKLFKGDFVDNIKKFFTKTVDDTKEVASNAQPATKQPDIKVPDGETKKTKLKKVKKPKVSNRKYAKKGANTAKLEPTAPKIQYIPPYQRSEEYGQDILVDLIKKRVAESKNPQAVQDVIEEVALDTPKVPQILSLPEPKKVVDVAPAITQPKTTDMPQSKKTEDFYCDLNNSLAKRFRHKVDSSTTTIKKMLTELKAKVLPVIPFRKAKMAKNASDVSGVDIKDIVRNPRFYMDEQAKIYPLRKVIQTDAITPVDLLKEKCIKEQKLNKIIAEVDSWNDFSDNNEDFELVFDKCKKAMMKPIGEALPILDEAPKVEISEEKMQEARKMAKHLQEQYRAQMQLDDSCLNDIAFEDYDKKYVWQPGDTFRIYDPVLKQNIGFRYKFDKNLSPQPQIQNVKKR